MRNVVVVALVLCAAAVAQVAPAPSREVCKSESLKLSLSLSEPWEAMPGQALEQVSPPAKGARVFCGAMKGGRQAAETIIFAELDPAYGRGGAKEQLDSVVAHSGANIKFERQFLRLDGSLFDRVDRFEQGGDVFSIMAAEIRGRIMVVVVVADKDEHADAIRALQRGIHFTPDWTAPGYLASLPTFRQRVSLGVLAGLQLTKVNPVYPQEARTKGAVGDVSMRVLIGYDGSVQAIWFLSGNPLLFQSALAAVSQWKYKPYYLDGQPIGVESTVVVHFKRE